MKEEFSEGRFTEAIQKGFVWGGGSIVFLVVLLILLQKGFLDGELSWSKIRWGWLFLGWFCMCSALMALGKRWQVLLPEYPIENSFLTASLLTALLLNYAIPGPFGEVAASWFLQKRYNVPIEKGLVSGTAARLIGLATAAIGVLFFWPYVDISEEISRMLGIVIMGVGFGLLILGMLMFLPASLRFTLEQRGEKSRFFKLLSRFAEAFLSLRIFHIFLLSSFWSFVGHVIAGIGVWISIYAVYGVQSGWGIGFSYLLGTCIGAIAFLFPGAQLTWDATLALLLTTTTSLEPLEAGIMTAILRIEQIGMMLLGVISLVWIQSRLSRS